MNRRQILQYVNVLFTLIAFVLLFDFAAPGEKSLQKVVDVKKERQQHYNASGNRHFFYQVTTSNAEFYIEQDITQTIERNDLIQYSNSMIFNEVNWYRPVVLDNKYRHSFRLFSGLILPLVVLIAFFVFARWDKTRCIIVRS
jgi:hypothetical protein